ncbi:cmp/dcmp deaminase, zinc-binding protein [Clohesyomyces aquaticus]|uniref:Cmp/dcmp deaminase, zinc-binding protein n=1 Tax=Clohesyomyces aquaticus TaxID=1231657 RepID=A0A1Y1YZV5_9PLEO|nr:cmp/dcmp deaminase, zinc-binding protein [Clohesyomyces aquaticus]
MASSKFPERPTLPTKEQFDLCFAETLDAQVEAMKQGKRPFVALLIGPDNRTVLLKHFSISHVDHAEASLARLAAIHYTQEYLWTCALYSSWEPCAMCAATCYWANIGRVVYAARETELLQLTGEGNEENMTLNIPCREIFAKGQKDIQVIGPVEKWEKHTVELSDKYWRPIRENKMA